MLHNWEPIFPLYIFDRGSQVMQVGLQLTVWARPSMKLNCVLSRAFYPSTSGNHCFSFITTKQKDSTRCSLTFQYSLQTLQKSLMTVQSWHCISHTTENKLMHGETTPVQNSWVSALESEFTLNLHQSCSWIPSHDKAARAQGNVTAVMSDILFSPGNNQEWEHAMLQVRQEKEWGLCNRRCGF